ncbi:MAG: PH domain-containing protein [Planctomycetes bacterium]|nr:PH domain-containing protein [Planctomycetota bacterium]
MEATRSRLDDAALRAIKRPHRNLLVQYTIRSLAGLVLAPLVWIPHYFKYHTLNYTIGDEGISASWGILFRREVHLAYKRIQDIHVKRSLVERYLGIGTVELQTAAGSATAELALEGMEHFEALREFFYRRMRGVESTAEQAPISASADEVLELLRAIRVELDGARAALEAQRGS